jgi:predicted dehydrogenase
MSPPIRLAIVGCGRVVETFHAPALRDVNVFTPTVVVERDDDRGRAVAATFGHDVAIAASIAEALDRCDAALVALPNGLHARVCVELLEHGRHVLVEKPMATTTAECDRMIAAARASGAVLRVGLVRRFIPAYQLVAGIIAAGVFGALRRITVREGVVYDWPATTGFFLSRREAGGGVLVDFGSHVLDALSWWTGGLTLASYADDAFGGVEAECRIELTAARGVEIVVELSRLRRLPCTAKLEFALATLELNLHSGAVDMMLGGSPAAVRGRVGAQSCGAWAPPPNQFVQQLAAFADDIHRGTGVSETAETARDVAELFEHCQRARKPLGGPASPVEAPIMAFA